MESHRARRAHLAELYPLLLTLEMHVHFFVTGPVGVRTVENPFVIRGFSDDDSPVSVRSLRVPTETGTSNLVTDLLRSQRRMGGSYSQNPWVTLWVSTITRAE